MLNKEKALHPPSASALGLFIFDPYKSKLLMVQKQKSPALSRQGFSFVAECVEISNLDLIRDIVNIIKLQEFLQLRK